MTAIAHKNAATELQLDDGLDNPTHQEAEGAVMHQSTDERNPQADDHGKPDDLPEVAWADQVDLLGTSMKTMEWEAVAFIPFLEQPNLPTVDIVEIFKHVGGQWVANEGPKIVIQGEGSDTEMTAAEDAGRLIQAISKAAIRLEQIKAGGGSK